MKKIKLIAIVPYFFLKKRLDQVLVILFKQYSRVYLKHLIKSNQVLVNQRVINKPNKKVFGGEKIIVYVIMDDVLVNFSENISLNIIYEDDIILVINKPPGVVVHPGPGHEYGTIFDALLHRYNNSKNLPRAGIVHRLDKDTSGLMIVAKNLFSYNYLLKQIKERQITRKYQSIVQGNMISGNTIDAPIMRHSVHRTRMTINNLGKKSITHYRIIQRFKHYTHIEVTLETGRTHQIRVHMQYIKYPIVGDTVYKCIRYNLNYINSINQFHRQALHAHYLSFYHPISQSLMFWEIPLPKDMQILLKDLQKI
ncbi:MAG: 23S rRNA pseudouridine(1911/1915/1917) synthase RluD [Buchnera aphidicola (Pentalonia nigronervosa)]|uniref:Pseudouridine synthase n=1 Tax=Buchnera aphidicola (Pentalonia nigronervosa) TaxID=1309793 RepID=A0A7H1B013_9GAMM|nr:MAG: 23S rRNA pseudouridine(1911/1915/1917) synthase RluD [Buchnera aphidicola (Pentalonia nigronervosa)]